MRTWLVLLCIAVVASVLLPACAGMDRRTATMPPPPPETQPPAPPPVVGRSGGPSTVPPPPPAVAPAPRETYTVKKGESLWKIAGRADIYGDSTKWRRIYEANKHQLPDPNKLKPGMVLIIPRN